MEIYCVTRGEWRSWLEINHSQMDEIWLVYYKKGSGKARIPYRDALEEAICFGWIDGKIKSVNEDYYIQRFTPRRKGSRWSRINVEIAERMIASGLMTEFGHAVFKKAIDSPGLIYERQEKAEPDLPVDLQEALLSNNQAMSNFEKFPPSCRRNYINWLNSAKKEETRNRRIAGILQFATDNIKQGML